MTSLISIRGLGELREGRELGYITWFLLSIGTELGIELEAELAECSPEGDSTAPVGILGMLGAPTQASKKFKNVVVSKRTALNGS